MHKFQKNLQTLKAFMLVLLIALSACKEKRKNPDESKPLNSDNVNNTGEIDTNVEMLFLTGGIGTGADSLLNSDDVIRSGNIIEQSTTADPQGG